ncbi:hypothetical protein KFL_010700010 [Klebsormidium nitens]|uniref:Retrovirus-related Pol polyprotein from transposon TNT 1-94-like beta-barrel domain-containing protein n=1 Tax=Klebsormidium nitens TaxID=105231 RepID=A0A1Y1ISU2_KLENI|nr:hypothetical protein KFL_010700010 [Klebsormidium nitens]|eukprot:GAQ92609.1 hypothetical protein KFL_010700010 [Klebsormidium nitens]
MPDWRELIPEQKKGGKPSTGVALRVIEGLVADEWLVDSGSSHHLTKDKSLFETLEMFGGSGREFTFGDQGTLWAEGSGSVELRAGVRGRLEMCASPSTTRATSSRVRKALRRKVRTGAPSGYGRGDFAAALRHWELPSPPIRSSAGSSSSSPLPLWKRGTTITGRVLARMSSRTTWARGNRKSWKESLYTGAEKVSVWKKSTGRSVESRRRSIGCRLKNPRKKVQMRRVQDIP